MLLQYVALDVAIYKCMIKEEAYGEYHGKQQQHFCFTLFIPFTVLFILAFAIFMSYFIITESDKAKTDSFITMQNNAITISDNLDAEVTKLDTVSQNIIYSSILKEEFSDYIEYQQSGRGNRRRKIT